MTQKVTLTLNDSTMQRITAEAARRGIAASEIMSEFVTLGAASLPGHGAPAPAQMAAPAASSPEYYTVAEAAEKLRLQPRTVANHCRTGKLKAVKIGAAWKITPADLAAYEQGESNGKQD